MGRARLTIALLASSRRRLSLPLWSSLSTEATAVERLVYSPRNLVPHSRAPLLNLPLCHNLIGLALYHWPNYVIAMPRVLAKIVIIDMLPLTSVLLLLLLALLVSLNALLYLGLVLLAERLVDGLANARH
jgi:hypothetical protein